MTRAVASPHVRKRKRRGLGMNMKYQVSESFQFYEMGYVLCLSFITRWAAYDVSLSQEEGASWLSIYQKGFQSYYPKMGYTFCSVFSIYGPGVGISKASCSAALPSCSVFSMHGSWGVQL